MPESSTPPEKTSFWKRFGTWLALAISLPIVWAILICALDWATPSDMDAWGSSFNFLSTIFTGIAMVGGAMAYFAQKATLDEQRKAYDEQTKLNCKQIAFIEEQSKFIKTQNDALEREAYDRKKQGFDHAFFQMVDRISRVFNDGSNAKSNQSRPKDQDSASSNQTPHTPFFGSELSTLLDPLTQAKATSVAPSLTEIQQNLGPHLTPKLKQILHLTEALLELLHSEDLLSPQDRQLYLNLLRAHLSEEHLIILAFGALMPSYPKLQQSIALSHLLLHLKDSSVSQPDKTSGCYSLFELLKQHYPSTAFKADIGWQPAA